MMKNRCRYCAKEISNELEFCSDTCEVRYHDEITHDTKNIKYFISGIVSGVIISFAGVLCGNDRILGAGIMFLGAVVILLPFTTPETTIIFGYKRAKTVGRVLGMLLELTGIWIAFL